MKKKFSLLMVALLSLVGLAYAAYEPTKATVEIQLTKANIEASDYLSVTTDHWATGKSYGGGTYVGDFYNMSKAERQLSITVKNVSKFEVLVQNSNADRSYTVTVGDGTAQTINHGGTGVESSGEITTGTTGEVTITLAGTGSSVYPVAIKLTKAEGGEVPTPEPVAEKTIYLNPAIWDVDEANERYAVYAFDNVHGTNAWFDFAAVNDGQGTYAATITGSYTGIILARMNGETTENSFDNAWNQTEDITYSNVEDNTLFTIASWDGGANGKGTWTTSTYTAPVEQQEFTVTFTTDAGWDEVYAWTWTGDINHEGTWPGKKLTAVDGVYTYTYKGDAAPEKILFNGGDDTKKTSDMAFVDGKAYKWITATPLFAIQADVTYTYGKIVEVKDADDEVVATITFGNEGETGDDFKPTVAQTIEGYAGYVAQTSGGNGTNGNKTGGTTYTIKPKYDGQLSIAVKVGGGKKFHLLEDGDAVTPDDGSLDGFTPAETFFGTIDFAVTAGKAYKFYCDGSKLDIFGFDYTFTKPEPVPEPEQIIPDGAYYVMNANAGTLVNAEGATDAKGAPMTFTYNAEAETFTIAGADFFADKQWTVANQYEDMPGYYVITTIVEGATKYLTVDAEGNLTLADAADENATWIVLEKAYWEDIMNSTYTIAGTKNLTGTDNDWDVVEANQMKYNEETKLFEITYKSVIVTNDVQPQFKVVKKNMSDAETWYPASDESGDNNWVITPDYLGGEGEYDITITFDPSDSKEIGVTGLKIEDINITVEDGADIFEALIAAEMGKSPRNISINLVENGNYTITGPLTAYANFEIQGNGATIDASGLNYNLIQMVTTDNPAVTVPVEYVSIHNATVKGLKKALFYSTQKGYLINWLTIDNSIIELAADATTIDFTKGSAARNFNIENSTIYAPTATTKSFYSSQSGQKLTELDETGIQTFIVKNSTMYNLAVGKNFFTHRQNNQKWLAYTVENSIFVNCGKSGQVIKGMNGGQGGNNPTWTITGNAFNFDTTADGVTTRTDTSASEATGDTTEGEEVANSVAGVVTFTDAAAGDFNGEFQLAEGATAPESLGDPDWTITFKAAAPAGIELANIAALKNFSTDVMGSVAAVLTLTDAKVTFVTTKESSDYDDDWNPITVLKDYVLIEDASAGYLLEGSGLGSYVKAGDVLNGKLAISLIDNYGWGIYQATLTNGTEGVTITEGEVSPFVVTDENVSSYIEDNDFRLAQFNNVVINVSDGQVSFTAAVMGENEIDINDQYSIFSETIADGATGTLTGYMANVYGQAFFVPTAFEPDYYLVGNFNMEGEDWILGDKDYKLIKNEEATGEEYMIGVDLQANTALKVWASSNVWYPAGTGNDFTIDDAGNYTIYFRPNGDGGADWHYGCIFAVKNTTDGINTVKAAELNGAEIYNLAGQRIQSAQKGLYIVNGKKVVIK